jgi:hypothetical protein
MNSPSCRVAVLPLGHRSTSIQLFSLFSFSASFPCSFNTYSNSTDDDALFTDRAPCTRSHRTTTAHVLLLQPLSWLDPILSSLSSPYAPCDFKAAETWTTYVRKCARCRHGDRTRAVWTVSPRMDGLYRHPLQKTENPRAGVRVSAASQEKASPSIGPVVHAGYRIVNMKYACRCSADTQIPIPHRNPAFCIASDQSDRSNKGS